MDECEKKIRHAVCPWWIGYFLINPFRKLVHNPHKIVGPYIKDGMTVVDIGPGMGFFTLPMAKMTGHKGRIVCFDVQERMLRALNKRARKRGLLDRIDARVCSGKAFPADDLKGRAGFALAFAVMHEVQDQMAVFSQIYSMLVAGGRLLVCEPKVRIGRQEFEETVKSAINAGFAVISQPYVWKCRSVLFEKR